MSEYTSSRYMGDAETYEPHARIGEGGEGRVFSLRSHKDLVLKLYKDLDSNQRLRIEGLVSRQSEKLRRAAAWPIDFVRDPGGNSAGFVMEYLKDYRPLYSIYQVKSRMQTLPDRNFQFMVRVARNLATCVHFVHEDGLVIGDLNESNVMVAANAMVKLIDSDSFQIDIGGQTILCEVAKAELLAPELHGVRLDTTPRIQNNDLFPLAVLIFQALVFGRHPFAGKPKDHQEVSLEDAIREGHYVFTKRREIPLDPPAGISLDWLPEEIRELFERAFDRSEPLRPSALEWFEALQRLESSLVVCDTELARDSAVTTGNAAHVHWSGVDHCPWCEMEGRWRFSLFGSRTLSAPDDLLAESASLKELIDTIQAVPLPDLDPSPVLANELPKPFGANDVLASIAVASWPLSITLLTTIGNQVWTLPWAIVAGAALPFGLTGWLTWRSTERWRETRRYRAVLRRLEPFFDRWQRLADRDLYQKKLDHYQGLIKKYQDVNRRMELERFAVFRKMYQPEIRRFLSSYSILVADVETTGNLLRSDLYERGLRTAADVDETTLARIPGSRAYSKELIKWRENLEMAYWATSANAIPNADERRLRNEAFREQQAIVQELREAPEELKRLGEELRREQDFLLGEMAEDLAAARAIIKHFQKEESQLKLDIFGRHSYNLPGPPPLAEANLAYELPPETASEQQVRQRS
ncbi:MAG: hypothetical protein HONBIEJF_01030 [Fimbriimonadaceae bacterium]|nr:hypothetical protein [Fimbriimonadaceae bacterium]